VLPGYALTSSLFPACPRRSTPHAVYVVVLSMAATILSGLALNLVATLDRSSWAFLLFGVTLVASAAAAIQSDPQGIRRPRSLSAPAPAALAVLLAALGVMAAAAIVAHRGAERQIAQSRFSEFWAVPGTGDRDAAARSIQIGVRSHEPTPVHYLVRASRGSRVVRAWRMTLSPHRSWTTTLRTGPASVREPTTVSLRAEGRSLQRLVVRHGN
jgi:uncharacterized membrane protein